MEVYKYIFLSVKKKILSPHHNYLSLVGLRQLGLLTRGKNQRIAYFCKNKNPDHLIKFYLNQ